MELLLAILLGCALFFAALLIIAWIISSIKQRRRNSSTDVEANSLSLPNQASRGRPFSSRSSRRPQRLPHRQTTDVHSISVRSLDLHGLSVKGAMESLDRFLERQTRDPPRSGVVCVITGKGLHSSDGRAHIRPAVVSELERRGIRFNVPRNNDGRVLIHC